jgi:oxygen-independent coproporphyrinogen-3 oxidase
MIDAICYELKLKKNYLNNSKLDTIYFGGGTPSFLDNNHLLKIVNAIETNFDLNSNIEFTIECNPDDISVDKLDIFKKMGVNRLSIGIQSFDEEQLMFMNRAHNREQALKSIKIAQSKGFNNITIDLMYGLPQTDLEYWERQIELALKLNVNHISAYCLTIEQKTVFGNWHKKGQLHALADEESNLQFKHLIKTLKKNGFEQYEISNFAKNQNISLHNSSYWLGKPYIGIGPSAHSYNGDSRQWNISHNIKYIKKLKENKTYYELENLTVKDKFNEYILTRLRTKWGISVKDLKSISRENTLYTLPQLNEQLKAGNLSLKSDTYMLTDQGKFIADYITSLLFI